MNQLIFGIIFTFFTATTAYSETSQESKGLKFDITQDRKPLTVKLEFTNTSNKTIYFFFSECPVEFLNFSLYGKSGKIVYAQSSPLHAMACNPSNLKILKSGDRFTYSVETNRWGTPPKGSYFIQYNYSIPTYWSEPHYQKMFKEKFQGHENDYWQGNLTSNQVPIDIE